MLSIYLDDSGDETEPIQTMAGFIGTAEGWREFEAEASEYLRACEIPYLHTVDLYHRKGPFEGWHSGQTRRFAKELFRILGDHTGRGLEFSVLRNRFNEQKQVLVPAEGSPYEFCFKGMVSQLLQDAAVKELLSRPNVDLSFVIGIGLPIWEASNERSIISRLIIQIFDHWHLRTKRRLLHSKCQTFWLFLRGGPGWHSCAKNRSKTTWHF